MFPNTRAHTRVHRAPVSEVATWRGSRNKPWRHSSDSQSHQLGSASIHKEGKLLRPPRYFSSPIQSQAPLIHVCCGAAVDGAEGGEPSMAPNSPPDLLLSPRCTSYRPPAGCWPLCIHVPALPANAGRVLTSEPDGLAVQNQPVT